jgi:hypothetical protein
LAQGRQTLIHLAAYVLRTLSHFLQQVGTEKNASIALFGQVVENFVVGDANGSCRKIGDGPDLSVLHPYHLRRVLQYVFGGRPIRHQRENEGV